MSYILKEPVDLVVLHEIMKFALMSQDERAGEIVEINFPGLPRFVETIKKRRLMLPENKIVEVGVLDSVRHVDAPRSSSGKSKEAIRPGRSRQRRKPVIANRK